MVNWGFREYWFLKLFPFPNLDNLLNSEKLYEKYFFRPPPNDRNSCLAVLTTNRKWCPYPKLCFYQVWRKSCEPFLRLLGGGRVPFFSKKMSEPPSGRYWCLVGRTTIRKWYPHPNYNSIKFEENSVSHFWGYKGRGSPIFFEKIGARYWQILMSGGENDHPKIMSLPQTMFLSSLEKIVWAVFEVIRGGVPFFRKNKLKK